MSNNILDSLVAGRECAVSTPTGKTAPGIVAAPSIGLNTTRRKPKTNRAADPTRPQGYDACQTPAYALNPLLPYLKPGMVVWEAAAGEGLLAAALRAGGIEWVIASDVLTGQNFFDYEPPAWDVLITNPPYSIKYKWLARCYALGKPFALLLPVETLGAKTAQKLFRAHGLEVIFMDKRVNFKMPEKGWDGSSAQFPVCWVTWGLGLGAQQVFVEIKDRAPVCDQQIVKALPKEVVKDFEGMVIQAILRQYAWEAARLLGPGPLAAVMPVPQHEDEVAKQRRKRSKRNGHGNLRKRNRARAA